MQTPKGARCFFEFRRVIISGLIILAGCTHKSDPKILTIQLNNEPVSLDFSLAEDGLSMRVLGMLMNGLTGYENGHDLKNQIAKNIEKLDGGKKYRITLKPWKWSDGQNVRAAHFISGIRRTLDPKTPSKLSDLLFFIRNGIRYKKGEIKDFNHVGVRAVDDQTLEFTLESNFAFFPHILALSVAFPQRDEMFTGSRWNDYFPTTGRYFIEKHEQDQRYILRKNPHFPDFTEGPETIELKVIADENTVANLFEKGKLDIAFRLPGLELQRLRNEGIVRDYPFFATYYIGFNQRIPPWDKKEARRAFAQSIDREGIVKALGTGEIPAKSWIPQGIPGANVNIGIDQDVLKAKSSWNKSEFEKSLLSQYALLQYALLQYDGGSRNQLIVEKIKADVDSTLGLNLKLQPRDWKTHVRELTTSAPPLFRFGMLSVFVDPFAHLFLFESGNPNNYTGWKSAAFDKLLREIAGLDPGNLKNREKRQQLIDEAQRLVLEKDVVVVPVYHYVQTVAVSNRVQGFSVNGTGLIDFSKLKLKTN